MRLAGRKSSRAFAARRIAPFLIATALFVGGASCGNDQTASQSSERSRPQDFEVTQGEMKFQDSESTGWDPASSSEGRPAHSTPNSPAEKHGPSSLSPGESSS